jgi:hypothetical protein
MTNPFGPPTSGEALEWALHKAAASMSTDVLRISIEEYDRDPPGRDKSQLYPYLVAELKRRMNRELLDGAYAPEPFGYSNAKGMTNRRPPRRRGEGGRPA